MTCKAARHSFSLMEVMIVIVLVGVIGGVAAFSLKPFYQSYRFRTEVDGLYEMFEELQLEALTLQSDITVSFTNTNGKLSAKSSSDETVLKPQTIDLSHVDKISDEVKQIIFYSNGLVEPSKIIKLSSHDEHRWIDFRGKHLIKFWQKEPPLEAAQKLPDLREIRRTIEVKK